MAKIEPAVTQLTYLVPDGTSYVDLAKDLSKVNRRLYRQGYTYVIQDIQFFLNVGMKASDVQSLQFSTAGNSWIVHNAWTKAFRAWRDQQRSVEDLVEIRPKWEDFKVYLDDGMRGGTTLEPYAGDGAVYQAGEWLYSQYVWDDDGTERETYGHLIGSDTGTSDFALIQNYADSRATIHAASPDQETEASTSMYAKLMTLGDDELIADLIDNMETTNDAPPYDQDDFPGGADNADHAVVTRWLSCNAQQGSTTVGGFIVPCGLLKIQNTEYALNDATSADGTYATGTAIQGALILTIAPGPYRGVLAAPMGQ